MVGRERSDAGCLSRERESVLQLQDGIIGDELAALRAIQSPLDIFILAADRLLSLPSARREWGASAGAVEYLATALASTLAMSRKLLDEREAAGIYAVTIAEMIDHLTAIERDGLTSSTLEAVRHIRRELATQTEWLSSDGADDEQDPVPPPPVPDASDSIPKSPPENKARKYCYEQACLLVPYQEITDNARSKGLTDAETLNWAWNTARRHLKDHPDLPPIPRRK